MQPFFELSTRSYEKEIPLVRKAMIDLEGFCKIQDGYTIGEPFTKAGWTFFTIKLSHELASFIEKSGLMKGAAGYRIGEQLTNFLGHYLESKGVQARIKKIDY